jgi:hypothetical protein
VKYQLSRRASLRSCGFPLRLLVAGIGLLSALQATGETAATSAGENTRWRGETVLQFSARADYASKQGHVTRRDATVSTMYLRFNSLVRPVTAGLMLEYSAVDEQADTLLVAGMFTYKQSKWTASASPFYVRTAQSASGSWRYWGSVRRRITSRQSLSVELFGALETGRLTKWMVGYAATITATLSVSVSAGASFNAGQDWLARTSLTWRPRPGRR